MYLKGLQQDRIYQATCISEWLYMTATNTSAFLKSGISNFSRTVYEVIPFIKRRYVAMRGKQIHRRYSKQFKTDAVELALRSNKSVVEIARDLGIRAELLYRWKAEQSIRQNKIHRFQEVAISKALKLRGFASSNKSSSQIT